MNNIEDNTTIIDDDYTKDDYEQKEPQQQSYDCLSNSDLELIDNFCNTVYSFIDENGMVGDNAQRTVQFWQCLANNFYKKRYEYVQARSELEKQKLDLEHFSQCDDMDSDEHMDVLKEIGRVLRERRDVKNIMAYLSVCNENLGKISGFIKGIENRIYTPRSVKYGGSDPSEQTTVKIDNIKQLMTNNRIGM